MKKKKRRYYATPCMIAIAVVAALTAGSGFLLRGTLLKDLPQYEGAPVIAIPMMLLQDSSPLREARARAEWEASERSAVQLTQAYDDGSAAVAAPVEDSPVEPAAAEESTGGPVVEAFAPVAAGALTAEPAVEEAFAPVATLVPADEPATAFAAMVNEMPTLEPEETNAPARILVPKAPEATAADALAMETAPDPVPAEVPESFFDHTLFIGDSKTDGMRMWGRLGEAEYFCGTSYSAFNIFDKKTSDVNFKKKKLKDVLANREYDQIYILLGYNECGYPYESFMDQFRYVISRVHEAQPKAKIILHGIMHASARVGRKYSYYTVDHIEMMNDGLRQMAAETEGLYYVDCNEAFCDENGYLLPNVSSDGEHLTPEYTAQWAQEIRKRAIVD